MLVLVIALDLAFFLLLFYGLRWLRNKIPKYRNLVSFFLELFSAYSASFMLDILIKTSLGELTFGNTLVPLQDLI